jgi:hypothetical protein
VRNKLGLLSREELAGATGRTVRALKSDAIRRVGPPPVVIGKQVFYRLTDVQDFLSRISFRPRPNAGVGR